ncbi:MAG TPA: tryptophan--tRNA ligase [Elusimicrobiota bacterium]|nr:tryptophan--tRNA ligase [Elusimicrobiota bacterium]
MKTVMSGMRPTGKLHLGNYWGALKNWVELQKSYRCYFMVADLHMFTTGYEDVSRLQDNVREMVLDWLAAGLDPEKCVIFLQSKVPQHAELATLLGMITPLSWLENNPTWKEQLQELAKTKLSRAKEGGEAAVAVADAAKADESLRTHGFLGYPVLQAADILIYGGELVPVGKDQEAHVELSREIARRFNHLYGATLVEPKPLFTETPKVPGADGRKMSKSYGNAVDILETPESLKTKVMGMYTDPKKLRANDPGHPDAGPDNPPGCTVYALHKLYSSYWQKRGDECRAGSIGCVACKKDLLQSLEGPFGEFRSRRAGFDAKAVERVLEDGSRRAREAAERTMDKVRAAMRLR